MIKHIHISTIQKHFIALVLCCITMVFSFAQQTSKIADKEGVKRLQRAIFIFNFAQQVGWENLKSKKDFKIGVLGPDKTILDLRTIAKRRKIHGKPVKVIRLQHVNDVENVQLLYVNNKYSYSIEYLLDKILGKNILLISEDYNFNTSMINMVNVGDSFEYEINIERIEQERFTVVPSLKKYAITSAEKWKRLYQFTEKTLSKIQEDKTKQEAKLKDKERQIQYQKDTITGQLEKIYSKEGEINERNKRIKKLYTQNEFQKKKYEERLALERELENNIKEQITYIEKQQEQIQESNREIKEQQEFLEKQKDKIKQQEKVLNEQDVKIKSQEKISLLLIALATLAFGFSFFIYRGYQNKKKYNKELAIKNQAFYKQSVVLEAKNRELEQFAYIASHDLQEPLNTISSFIDLLTQDYNEKFDEIGKTSLTFIKDASVRMKKLIDALLEYSRLGRSKDYVAVDCNVIIEDLKSDLKNRIEKTGASINFKDLPVVTGAEIELRLLFQNLISNGIKFRHQDTVPKIDILCKKKQDQENDSKGFWEFSVQDNGIGIPQNHQERIFAIFQRLHSRDKYEGTGIGLAHCKKIVESHGGKIWLSSTEGKGSIFYFTIPFNRTENTIT